MLSCVGKRVSREVDLESRMNQILGKLGLPLRAVWCPDPDNTQHARIVEDLILVFDEEPSQAFSSFLHEIVEFRMRPVLSFYRGLVNSLIGIVEKVAYERKEEALSLLIHDFKVLSEEGVFDGFKLDSAALRRRVRVSRLKLQ